MSADPIYWAAKPIQECVRSLDAKVAQFYEWIRTTGQYATWIRMNKEYYAGAESCGRLGTAGDQEEFVTVKENHLHSLGEHVVVMVTGSRPNFEPKAKNTDHQSATQTILGAALLDQAHREKDLEGVAIDCVRWAGQFSESYGYVGWDPTKGEPYVMNPDTGKPKMTGDLYYQSYMPIDVVRDVTLRRSDTHQWFILRDDYNRYDLAAKYPELADRIMALPTSTDDEQRWPRIHAPLQGTRRYESDSIQVWSFYHDQTDALPEGRYIQFVDADCWFFDGPLPTPWLPIHRMASEDLPGSQRGYTSFFDLLPLQHVNSTIKSLILSHINNYGTGVYWTKPGGNTTISDLKAGFKLLKSPEPPQAIAPPPIPDYMPEVARDNVATMEALSGINSVRRGTVNSERTIQPQLAALLDAKAIEFSYGLQRCYVRFLEGMATKTIQLYQRFAKAPQVAQLVGKANRPYMREFTGNDLSQISRVTVDIGNPLSRTTSGRMQLAQLYMQIQPSPIQTPQQLEEVLSTGRLEPAIEATRAELLRIRSENEALSDGRPVQACAYDHHPTDIREHLAVISSPEARALPQPDETGMIPPEAMQAQQVLEATLAHIQQHLDLWRSTDPAALAALGIPPPPPPPMPAPPLGATVTPPPQPGAPGGTVAPPRGAEDRTGPLPAKPVMPQMPINPETGIRVPSPIPPV